MERWDLSDLESDLNLAATVHVPVLISTTEEAVAEGLARRIHERSRHSHELFLVVGPGSSDEERVLRDFLDREGPVEPVTLFFPDISRAGRNLQVRMRDWLGDAGIGRRDVRVIAATRPGLYNQVENDAFDASLFYRLNKIHIHVSERGTRGDDDDREKADSDTSGRRDRPMRHSPEGLEKPPRNGSRTAAADHRVA